MIQRVQSLYLLLSAIFMGLVFLFPFVEFIDASSKVYELNFLQFKSLEENVTITYNVYPIAFFVGLSVLLSIVTIFIFKKRLLQMRFSMFNIIILIAILALVAFYTFKFKNDFNAAIAFGISSVFPIISIILILMAFRGIKKDEKLIRSVDRIR